MVARGRAVARERTRRRTRLGARTTAARAVGRCCSTDSRATRASGTRRRPGSRARTASWRPTRAGTGAASAAPADVSPEAFAVDAAHWIERLELAPAIVIGQSFGGLTALRLAARARRWARSALVVAEATPAEDPDGAAAVASWLAVLARAVPLEREALAFFGGDTLWAQRLVRGLEQRADGLWPAFERGRPAGRAAAGERARLLGRWAADPLPCARRPRSRRRSARQTRAHARAAARARGWPRSPTPGTTCTSTSRSAGASAVAGLPGRARVVDVWPAVCASARSGYPCDARADFGADESDWPARANAYADAFAHTRLRSRVARARRTRQPELGAAARARLARGRPARGDRPHRCQRDGGRGALGQHAGGQRGRRRRRGSPSRRRRRSPRSWRGPAPTSCSTRRCAATSSSSALLGWTSVCDLADLRTDPWRVAIALGSEGDGSARRASTASTCSAAAPTRGGSADWLAAGVKVPVWIVGDDARDPGRAAALRQRTSASCRHPRSSRAPRSAMRSIWSPAGTSWCARCRARPRALRRAD